MRIGINVSVLKAGENVSGIGYYTYRIVKELLDNDTENEYYLFSNCEISVHFPENSRVHNILYPCKNRLLWSRYLLGWQIQKFNLDIFWSPTHNLPIVKKKKTKYYMTVHDIANHILENISQSKSNQQKYLRLILDHSCKIADGIIAPSNATKNDLVEHFRVAPQKIFVIYEGGDKESNVKPAGEQELEEKYRVKKPYFLYVGTLQPRKNIETIVNAFLCLAKEELTSQLVLAGGTGWGMDKVLEKIQKSESKDRIVLTGYVSEEEKAGLYKNAEAFLFPSLYEGFGIPILESFSYGVPVITAKNSSLPEVGGDAAIYIENVMSSEELEERMKMVLGLSEADRILLSEKGIRQFNRFTWKKCAREISELFCGKNGLTCKGNPTAFEYIKR